MVDRNAKTPAGQGSGFFSQGCLMTPLLPKSKPIRIMKPEDFPPRPAPPEPGPELPPQPRAPLGLAPLNVDDVLELIGHFMPEGAPAAPETLDEALAAAEAELAALRARVAELEARDRSVFADAPLLPAPDALLSDYGPVGTDDITGDLLLDAFEDNEAETAAIVQTLSALRLKHLSEQLNVERARLDREHQATGVANPRSASIDRLLGLLTRRGEV